MMLRQALERLHVNSDKMKRNLWIRIALIYFLEVQLNGSIQVTVLDTTKTESLGWVTYSVEDDVTGRRGWKEASYTNTEGDVFRIYTVCNVANIEVDNWLRTPYVPRDDAHRVYVEVKFTMRKCTKYPDPERLQQCKESFKLLYYEAEADFANAMMPTWDGATYRHVDVIAADRVFTDVNDAVINTETRSVPVTRRGLYFAFQDQGACTTILSVRVFYIVCPSVVINYAVFDSTPSGLELMSIVQSDGTCVEHSAIEQQPSYLCQADGNWYYPTGGCQCMPGYQPGQRSAECLACPTQTYKWSASGEHCLPCPRNSEALAPASVQCQCLSGYFRAKDDNRSEPCTGPPSDVQNLTIAFLDQSMISLIWLPPLETGGRGDLRYRVQCSKCDDGAVFIPGQSGFSSTNITIFGLTPQKQYAVSVFAENGVTLASGAVRQTSITFRMSAPVPMKIGNVRVTGVGTDYASLVWDQDRGLPVEMHEVRYWSMDGRHNTTSVFSTSNNITISSLNQQTKYMIMVRCKTEKGWGEFSDAVYAVTGHVFQYPTESPVAIIAGSIVAIFVCLLIGLIMITVFMKRSRRSYREKAASHNDCAAVYIKPLPHLLDSVMVNSLRAQELRATSVITASSRTYVDPHTYEDPNEAVREFTKEIDLSCVIIESVIGGGEFGDVCKGILRILGKADLSVAIKTLKPGALEKSSRDFLTEASIMGQFDDPNVIYLEGVVTKTTPIMILTEYMANGSLDKFLKSNDGKLTVLQLVGMMRGIASGMRYLSEMGFIHRDLAARNILVSETLICKVADFGLSREVETDNSSGTYTTKGGKIPIRWTAPEAIAYRKFTSASDVWSYGVVMWEVMSYGEWPYWNWSNQDVIRAIDTDYRLPPPMDCPEAVYQLMRDCWQKERGHRPRFPAIVRTLDKLIRTPELLRKSASHSVGSSQLCNPSRIHSAVDVTTCAVIDDVSCLVSPGATFPEVDRWLLGIKMDRYNQVFREAGYKTIADLSQIRHNDLVRLGITLAGHQKKILSAVSALQMLGQQFSSEDASFV